MIVGIIGTSKIARQHARAVKLLGHQVIFANSGNPESQNTINCINEFPEFQQVSIKTLLNKHDCDSLISCLPVSLVDYYFEELYGHCRAILFEKPPYINKSTYRVKTEYSHLHRVGFNKRFFSSVEVLKTKVIEEAPIHVEINISEASNAHKYDQVNFQKINYLYYSSSSHILDLALYLFGTCQKINFRSVLSKSKNHFGYIGNIEFFNGIFATVSILINDPVRIGISCYFMNGERWVLSPLEKLTVYQNYEITEKENVYIYKPRIKFQVKTDFDSQIRPGILEQVKAFINKKDGTLGTFDQYRDFVSLVSKISSSQ